MGDDNPRDNFEVYQRLKRQYETTEAPKKLWYRPQEKLPPQGYKVLCQYGGGDYAVMQRFGDLWLPIPFLDSTRARKTAPDYWQHIDFVGENTGYTKVFIGKDINTLMDFDQLEKMDKETYDMIVEYHLSVFNSTYKSV